MSYHVEEGARPWDIVFWTRNRTCASQELQSLLEVLSDRDAADLLLRIGVLAYPPRDGEYLCRVVADLVEVYAMPVPRMRNGFVLLGAHVAMRKLYVLGTEMRDGQGHYAVCEKATKEGALLLESLSR